MPLYDYHCSTCNKNSEGYSNIEERNNQKCDKCNNLLKVQISGVNKEIRPFNPYYDEALDYHIESRDQKKRVLKERGLVQFDGHYSNSKRKKRMYFHG